MYVLFHGMMLSARHIADQLEPGSLFSPSLGYEAIT